MFYGQKIQNDVNKKPKFYANLGPFYNFSLYVIYPRWTRVFALFRHFQGIAQARRDRPSAVRKYAT